LNGNGAAGGGPTPANDRAKRQARLTYHGNPRGNLDYIVMLEGRVAHFGHHIRLTYVPDKLLLAAGSFQAYMDAFDATAPTMIELLAFEILDDINNEIVPRWVQVVITTGHGAGSPQKVIVEDRQPNWDNPHILPHLRDA
jgi:7-cyano-7-deazaguanine reductase